MSRSWGLAAVDLAFVVDRVIPYTFRSDDRDKPALLKRLDGQTLSRRLAVLDTLGQRLPPEVTGDDYDHPRRRAWQETGILGSEFARPFLILEQNRVAENIDRYLSSDPTTCLTVLGDQFATVFPDWAADIGPPENWPPAPWHRGSVYPEDSTAGLELVRNLWLAGRRGETSVVLPMNQPEDDSEDARADEIADVLDAHAMAILTGYAVAHTPTVWSGGGWVNIGGMFDHVQLNSKHIVSPRAVFQTVLPAGVLSKTGPYHYNNGRLTDDTWGVLGAMILPDSVGAVRWELVEVKRRLSDPVASFAAAERHLGVNATIKSLLGSLFGKPKQAAVPREEVVSWAEGFAADSEATFALFDEALSYAESHGLALVETSAQSIEWPVGLPQ
jgi:hypothetical protein